jgi:magnesium-protoporphyrin O-methyltransferase
MADYSATRDRVEEYFDRSATKVWAQLTSDAPVSRIRQSVREGRDKIRALMLGRLPADLKGCRILDAGCGTGQMTAELAMRGADVTAVDISPSLVDIACKRLPQHLSAQVHFTSGDMTAASLGTFDYVMAMDSLIYYATADIAGSLDRLGARTTQAIVFTVAPKTAFLMAFWTLGKAFPRADRSPTMVPHAFKTLNKATGGKLQQIERVSHGFYISECLEYRR